MKAIRLSLVIFMCLLPVLGSNAGKVYTWTDEKGVTHITETPPPPNARDRDVIEYVPKTKEEEAAIRQQQQQSRDQEQKGQIAAEAKNARQKANRARAKAIELKTLADQLFQQSEAFKTKTSNTIRRWQTNKSTRLKLEKEAAEAQKRAIAADEEATRLEKRAADAEKRLKEEQAKEESLAAEKSAPVPQ
jgi:hypothetical protein